MTEKKLKYLFFAVSFLLLFFMLLMTRKAGITCDEVLHYNHSLSVYNYFATFGNDKSSLDTPVTHLQYYGQSYDNIVTILTKWFGIKDIYAFRNIMSLLAGWLTIMITAAFAIWLEGYMAGILVVILFGLSPVFLGHSQNNLKDVPFALGYIAGLYYILKHLASPVGHLRKYIILIILSIAFCLSIRAGGLVLICYLFFFFFIYHGINLITANKIDPLLFCKKFATISVASVIAYFLGIILWPYALQNPLLNVYKSYEVMAQYPDTFRQIFNGKEEWSDFMPWYYLPEYMAITIPIVVLSGFVIFFAFSKKIFTSWRAFAYGGLLFSILFPICFAILEKANLYSAWRQFLFVYPGIILISAVGFIYLIRLIKRRYLLWIAGILFIIISINPLRFMFKSPEYSYIYFNQIVGGMEGSYGRFESDYYFVSLKEGSEWLKNWLKEKKTGQSVKVMANFSVQWYFRDHPEIQTGYIRFEERSMSDWDYAIITNRYIPPFQLINKSWPPDNAIKIIYADRVPVCAVIERKTKDDYYGYKAIVEGRTKESLSYFEKALKENNKDEMIYYNFAAALMDDGQPERADSCLHECLKLNPEFDLALMYLGNIAASKNRPDEAAKYYEMVIKANRRYLEAYVELSKLFVKKDAEKSRRLLFTCLEFDPEFKPAIIAMADSYRETDPETARKYDELAKGLK